MPVKAILRHSHIAPRKAKIVIDLIRGLDVVEAENQLKFLNKKGSDLVLKLLLSAASNAIHTYDMDKDNLYVKKIVVNEAPTMKRFRPRAFGRAYTIRRRTSHIEIELDERVKGRKKTRKLTRKDAEADAENAEKKLQKESENKTKTGKPWDKDKGQKRGLFGRKLGGGKKVFQRKAM